MRFAHDRARFIRILRYGLRFCWKDGDGCNKKPDCKQRGQALLELYPLYEYGVDDDRAGNQ